MHWRYVLWGGILLFSSQVFSQTSANVPSQSRNYEWMNRLEAYGCAVTNFRGFGPQSHGDFVEALAPYAVEEYECPAPEWLLKERQILLRPTLQTDASIQFVAVDSPRLSLLGLEATLQPQLPLWQGRPLINGATLLSELNLNASGGNEWGVAFSATPGLLLGLEDYSTALGKFYMQEWYVKGGYRRTELTVGKISPRFGEAKHGTLILSNAASPLEMIKFAIRPHWSGFLADHLGPITFETWLARTDSESFVKNSKLWAVLLGIRPFTFFEFGLLNLMQFGGEGTPDVGVGDLAKMFIGLNDDELSLLRQRSIGTYLGIWGPSYTFKFYNEFFFSELGSDWFSENLNTLLGIWFPKLGNFDLRLEYVHTVPDGYSNPIWGQGWSHRGAPLGHPLGNDAEGIYFDIGLPDWDGWRPAIETAIENRYRSAVLPSATRGQFSVALEVSKRWLATELLLRGKYLQCTNCDYTPGVDDTTLGGWVALRYSLF